MTISEAESVIGLPPGFYDGVDLEVRLPTPKGTPYYSYWGNLYGAIVAYEQDGSLISAEYVSGNEIVKSVDLSGLIEDRLIHPLFSIAMRFGYPWPVLLLMIILTPFTAFPVSYVFAISSIGKIELYGVGLLGAIAGYASFVATTGTVYRFLAELALLKFLALNLVLFSSASVIVYWIAVRRRERKQSGLTSTETEVRR